MSPFSVGVVLRDGSQRDEAHRFSTLADAVHSAFAIADRLSVSAQAADADVRWVNVLNGDHLEISIQIIPGMPLQTAPFRRP